MPLQITVTDAGRAEIAAAAIEITEVGLGSGKYITDPSQTAMQSEIKRLTSDLGQVAGLPVSADTIHTMLRDQTTDIYTVSEIGLYTANGTLFAIYSDQNNDFISKLSGTDLMLAVDIKLNNINVENITLGDINFINPPASQTVKGVAFIATDDDIANGTDNTKIVTPKQLSSIKSSATNSANYFGVNLMEKM